MAETMEINGHVLERTGTGRFTCKRCGAEGDVTLFSVGKSGCLGNPASFKISVCPGGERCEGHMDTDSAEYRVWKAVPSASSALVPRYSHTTDDLAERAASAYIAWADGVGMRFSVWAQEGFKVGPDGGKVAEMTFRGESWAVWVDHLGHITARRDN